MAAPDLTERTEALKNAVKFFEGKKESAPPEHVVATAEQFLMFLKGAN